MVKGINRQVIEINDTGSVYYEKAWFMVKPAYAQMQQNLLEKEAKSILAGLDVPSSMKPKRNFGFWLFRMSCAAAFGAGLSFLLERLF